MKKYRSIRIKDEGVTTHLIQDKKTGNAAVFGPQGGLTTIEKNKMRVYSSPIEGKRSLLESIVLDAAPQIVTGLLESFWKKK
jgi:hypothetical protein